MRVLYILVIDPPSCYSSLSLAHPLTTTALLTVWRDRLRLQALEDMGYEVYSCDLGHSEDLGKDNRHLQVGRTNGRRPSKRASDQILLGMQ